jgi:O-antigen ligase
MDRFRWSMLVAIGSVAYASLHVLAEWQKYGGMSFGYRPGWITGDPNYFSVSALLCLPLTFYMMRSKQARWERLFCQISLVLTIASLTLAGSRGAFLGLTAAAGFVVWKSEHRKRTLAYALLILVPLMVVTPSSPLDRLLNPTNSDIHSSDTRQFLWAAGVKMIEAYPITGIGLGKLQALRRPLREPRPAGNFIAHNTYVEVTAEMGFPGILLFLAVIVSTFLSLGRVIKATDKSSLPHQAALGIQAGLCGFLVCAFFVSAEYQKLFWLLVFLSAALNALVPSAAAAPSPAVPPRRSRAAEGRVVAIAALALALGVAAPSIARAEQTAEPRLDTYGGLPVRVSEPTGVFHVKKIGTRWIFVTPEGNAFWLRGVYAVGWGDGGTVAYESYKAKYNSDQIAFATHALRRIKSWGFNAIGPYSSRTRIPSPRACARPEIGTAPLRPRLNASWYGSIHEPKTKASRWHLAPSPFKTLLSAPWIPRSTRGGPATRRMSSTRTSRRSCAASRLTSAPSPDRPGSRAGTQAEHVGHDLGRSAASRPFDDALAARHDARRRRLRLRLRPWPRSSGYRGVIHPHIGWIVAVTRPTQTSNAFVGSAFGLKQTVEYAIRPSTPSGHGAITSRESTPRSRS